MTIMKWLRNLFRRRTDLYPLQEKEMVQIDTRTGEQTPVRKTEAGKLWKIIATNHCPDCNGEGFYEGPSGGMSTNIECATCGRKFNVTPVTGRAERI
jgi:hypothetical protein